MTPQGQLRTFEGEVPDPYKTGTFAPIRMIPGADNVFSIKPDLMHAFNLGVGGDLAASGLVALLRMRVFAGRSGPVRFDTAYDKFDAWCAANKKSSSIKTFDLGKFKMQSNLGRKLFETSGCLFRGQLWTSFELHLFIA